MAETIASISLDGADASGIEQEPGLVRADALLADLKQRVEAAHALEREGWEVGTSAFMGPLIRAYGHVGSLEQALEVARRCRVPGGTAVEWATAAAEPNKLPLSYGGGFVDGPVFGAGKLDEILIRDPYGRESLHPTRAEALRIVCVVINDYAERVGQLYPGVDELVDGVRAHVDTVTEDDLHGLWQGLVHDEVLNETIMVKAMAADHFRWGGFKAAVEDPESPDRLANTVALGWGPIALELALEGWRRVGPST